MELKRGIILLSLLLLALVAFSCQSPSTDTCAGEERTNPCSPNPCTEGLRTWCVDGGYGNAICLCDPGYRDYGTGLCLPADPCADEAQCREDRRWCLNERGRAVCGSCLTGYEEVAGQCREKTQGLYVGPFVAGENYLRRWDRNEYKDIFLRGVDLGVGVPGSQPSELNISRDSYRRWIARMKETGFNCVRIYTLHFPRFYEELRAYNLAHPDDPLYVIHGVWLTERDGSGSEDLFELTDSFHASIKEAIDSVHGNSEIEERRGRAYGKYEANISPWVIGWLIGREILATEVLETDDLHSDVTSFEGEAFRIRDTNPTSVWVAQALDYTVVYERTAYGVQRPVALSNWLETDPLDHPTEHRSSKKDVATIDLAFLEPYNAPAGFYASYHVYPYYPNFVSDDPVYRGFSDEMGPNSYLGILHDLKGHYGSLPVLVAEFGVPSSHGNAHFSFSGMHHGGHTETQQGIYAARMLRNIWDSGYAGAVYFHWMDGWFKRIWILNQQTFPPDRLPLWPDVVNPQQNYGLIAFDVGEPDYEQWEPVTGEGRIQRIQAAANAAYFYTRITLASPLEEADSVTVGYDTYRDDLGESRLPDGTQTARRCELSLVFDTTGEAQLYVTEAYDLFDMLGGSTSASYRSVPSDSGVWNPVRWKNSLEHLSKDESIVFPATIFELGRLRVNREGEVATSLDMVTIRGNVVELRIPWTLLQFTDPSTLTVLHDDRSTPGRETEVTEGIALVVSIGGEQLDTDRFRWEGWNKAPANEEREKPALEILSEALRQLPTEP